MVSHQEIMSYDVVIVGAGPAGLSAAIRLKQLAPALRVCVLEKGATVGAHIVSGAVFDPRCLQQLLPETWHEAPLDTKVASNALYYLSAQRAYRLPTPPSMHSNDCYLISLGALCQFLSTQAEALGCEIYPGFAASHLLYDEKGQVQGVATGDFGVNRQGQPGDRYQPGMSIHARQVMLSEGCRGHLSEQVIKKFKLRPVGAVPSYALGMKEVWRIPAAQHQPGVVIHTLGWPLERSVYGGSFLYHVSEQRIALGLVVGLDYKNPSMDPFLEFQQWKTHPFIRDALRDGERLSFGARALSEGGWQALPQLTFPGGLLMGDGAGFLNVARLKGIDSAMQSGLIAAETTAAMFNRLTENENKSYAQTMKSSWIYRDLYTVRNIRPGFRYGLWSGLLLAALETYVTRGKLPWTLRHREDSSTLKPSHRMKKIHYPPADGQLRFDRASSLYLANVYHEHDQPIHLQRHEPSMVHHRFDSPETRYCPAGVYELVHLHGKEHIRIQAQNCLHCKTCDIKDPQKNIVWTAPEGGGGPQYVWM